MSGELEKSFEVLPVDVFLIYLLHPGHQSVIFLHLTHISLEEGTDTCLRSLTAQEGEGLIDNIRLRILLLVDDSR